MTDKVDSAIYIFDSEHNRVKTIRLQTFLNRVNHTLRHENQIYFALKDDAKKFRKEYNLKSTQDIIGLNIRNKEPSAELKPGQIDKDSLPDYSELDLILRSIIDEKNYPTHLIGNVTTEKTLKKIQKLVKLAEFKRFQAPPILKLSSTAFGSGWRRPIASI